MLSLLLVAAVIVIGPLVWRAFTASQEARTVSHIEKLGGSIERDESSLGHPVVKVDFTPYRSSKLPPVSDADLAFLGNLTRLRELNLEFSEVTDNGMSHLAKLSQLERLNLRGTSITDTGLKELKGLRNLRYLSLPMPPGLITDAGLAHLKQMTKLTSLDVSAN